MFCKYCGKKIDDDASFCKYCGKSQDVNYDDDKLYPQTEENFNLVPEAENQKPSNDVVYQTDDQGWDQNTVPRGSRNSNAPRRRIWVVVVIIIIIIALICILFAVRTTIRNNREYAAEQTETSQETQSSEIESDVAADNDSGAVETEEVEAETAQEEAVSQEAQSDDLAESDSHMTADGEYLPGPNSYDGTMLPLDEDLNLVVQRSEPAWFKFTTGENDKSNYLLTVTDRASKSNYLYITVYDELGEEIGYTMADESGEAVTITCEILPANTVYNIKMEFGNSGHDDGSLDDVPVVLTIKEVVNE